jgi:hypothetical protein
VLSSAGNDGCVRIWKASLGGVWRPAGHVTVEQAPAADGAGDGARARDGDAEMRGVGGSV